MKKILQRILGEGIKKRVSSVSKISGFTLLELLVAAAIAGIIVSSLLAFLVSILQTDQREQAKVQTQEEVQAALDFIADDLKEALYIYDADGLERLSTDDPPGVRDQIPGNIPAVGTGTPNRSPVLVFWKRHFYAPEETITIDATTGRRAASGTDREIRDLPRGDDTGEGRFVRSLVSYYLRSNRNGSLVTRSNSMQIVRIEIRDGIRSDCQDEDVTSCNGGAPVFRVNTDGDTSNDVNGGDENFWVTPDQNFRKFEIGGTGSIRDRYNRWQNNQDGFNLGGVNADQVVLDFVDDNFYTAAEDDGTPSNSSIFVPIRPNTAFSVLGGAGTNNFFGDNGDCADPSIGVGRNPANGDVDADGNLDIATQRIPSGFSTSTAVTRADNSSSFFACVNSVQNLARVWIRGNALVRLSPNNVASRRILPIGDSKSNFLTTASVRATGRSEIVPPSQ